MELYHNALKTVLEKGTVKTGRNSDTISYFGLNLRFNCEKHFPIITTKKIAFKTMAIELLWFISGQTDNNELTRLGCNIWTANAEADYWKPKAKFSGDLGRVYGAQWRTWQSPDGKQIDQLNNAVNLIKNDPNNRRIIVSAWNPAELNQMALPPCHVMYQFYVENEYLSLQMYQRSADMFLGLPFNISSYALMLNLIAHITNKKPKDLIISIGDAHIYSSHIEQVNTQLARNHLTLPTLWVSDQITDLKHLTTKHLQKTSDLDRMFKLENYEHHPAIKAEMYA